LHVNIINTIDFPLGLITSEFGLSAIPRVRIRFVFADWTKSCKDPHKVTEIDAAFVANP
jgi:hypothetical protein